MSKGLTPMAVFENPPKQQGFARRQVAEESGGAGQPSLKEGIVYVAIVDTAINCNGPNHQEGGQPSLKSPHSRRAGRSERRQGGRCKAVEGSEHTRKGAERQ